MLEFYQPEPDLGTPVGTGTDIVALTIDGVEVTVPEGTSVMRAAALAGIKVPKLCATDSLEPFGSCRVCLVDIGASAGHTLIAAKGLGLNAIGIDVSRDAVATCQAKALQARQGSMTDTGLPDARLFRIEAPRHLLRRIPLWRHPGHEGSVPLR